MGSFVLFPKVPDNLKTNMGEEAYNPNGKNTENEITVFVMPHIFLFFLCCVKRMAHLIRIKYMKNST